ncbi:MAG: IDEAL domain-containing protein [Clostridia bacterium]|nr:IDEAL domain-containing protein [Clostridia bacterium]
MGNNTTAEKRELIYWFLDSQRLAAPGAEMILRRLLISDALLERVTPVSQVPLQGNLLLVAARGTYTHPFLLRLNGREVYDVEQAMELIEGEEWEDIKLYLSINRAFYCQFCAAVQHPEAEVEAASRHREITREMLMTMIDQALDHRDKRAFDALVSRLRKLDC